MKRWVLAVLLGSAVLAQNPAPPIIRIDVNLVQVDAVVTDSHNRHVSTLKADDFVVLQDGEPQTISNFSYVTTGNATSPDQTPAIHQTGVAAPVLPGAAVKPADVRRLFALVADDLGLSFTSIASVRDALRKFVDHQMQPGDLVAIIRTSGGLGVLQQFTTDRTLLHAAIDHLKFNTGRAGVDSFAPLGQVTNPNDVSPVPNPPAVLTGTGADQAIDQVRDQMFRVGTLGALRYVIDGLHDMPGRKSVVLFSENMELFNMGGSLPANPFEGSTVMPIFPDQVNEAMHRLIDAANRAAVVIYTIDPRGVQVLFPGAADSIRRVSPGAQPSVAGQAMMDRQGQMFDSQQGLWMLAKETGGLFIHNDNFVDDAINQAIADSEGYYLIGYHPDSDTFDAKTHQAKYHSLQIRLKTPGLRVRSRSGFFGQSDEAARTVKRSPHDELIHALTSPFSSGDVPMRLTALFEQSPAGLPFLNAMLHIDASHIQFAPQPDGGRKATLEVAAMTFGLSGQPVDQSDRRFEIALSAAQYAAVQANGLVYRVYQPLQHAGMYQVRVALRDEESGQLGSASQFMQTPDLTNGRLALSSLLLAEDTSGPSLPGLHPQEGRVAESDPTASAAKRVFKPGAALSYGYVIFNAQADTSGKPDVRVQTRIFRDNQPVYEGQPMVPNLAAQGDAKHLIAGGNMVLAKAIPPGDYVLQVVVVDKLAKQKYQTVAQAMDFEIRP